MERIDQYDSVFLKDACSFFHRFSSLRGDQDFLETVVKQSRAVENELILHWITC